CLPTDLLWLGVVLVLVRRLKKDVWPHGTPLVIGPQGTVESRIVAISRVQRQPLPVWERVDGGLSRPAMACHYLMRHPLSDSSCHGVHGPEVGVGRREVAADRPDDVRVAAETLPDEASIVVQGLSSAGSDLLKPSLVAPVIAQIRRAEKH